LKAARYGVSGTSAALSNLAIVDCHDRGHFIGSLSLKQAAPQWIWVFQETLSMFFNEFNRLPDLARSQQAKYIAMFAIK